MTPNLAQPSDLTPAQTEAEPHTPTDAEMRDWIVTIDGIGGHGGISIGRYTRWLVEHDRAKDAEIAALTGRIEKALRIAIGHWTYSPDLSELRDHLRAALTSSQPTTEKAHLHSWSAEYEDDDAWWGCVCGAQSEGKERPKETLDHE